MDVTSTPFRFPERGRRVVSEWSFARGWQVYANTSSLNEREVFVRIVLRGAVRVWRTVSGDDVFLVHSTDSIAQNVYFSPS